MKLAGAAVHDPDTELPADELQTLLDRTIAGWFRYMMADRWAVKPHVVRDIARMAGLDPNYVRYVVDEWETQEMDEEQ